MLNPAGIGWRHAHYAQLISKLPSLDFIEVHSENFFGEGGAARAVLHAARAHCPVSLHGVGLALGSACGIDEWHLSQLTQLVERIAPVRVSDHACFARADRAGRAAHASDLLPIPFNDEALAVMSANVQRVQERLKRPLLVENLSAYITPTGSDREEADFLVQLARRTGCGLLVDVNNIYVNALNAQRLDASIDTISSCRDWLDRIPASVVGEIHVAGHCVMGDVVIDDHGSRVCDDVWALHAHAIERFGPVPTLVEWDTDVPPLDVLLAEAKRARCVAQTECA
jgi:uncharacterized protein